MAAGTGPMPEGRAVRSYRNSGRSGFDAALADSSPELIVRKAIECARPGRAHSGQSDPSRYFRVSAIVCTALWMPSRRLPSMSLSTVFPSEIIFPSR